MKKVLQVIGGMNRAGAETMLMNIYRHIDKTQIQFDFLVFYSEKQDYEDEIESMGGKVIHMPLNKGIQMAKSVAFIRKVLRNEGPYCAIHAATLFNSVYPLLASIGMPGVVRVVHSHTTRNTLHRSVLRVVYEHLSRWLIKVLGQRFIACGVEAGEYLFGKRFHKDGIVINNAVNIDEFANADSSAIENLRKELGIDGDLVIGNVARLTEVKNHAKMIEIAQALKTKGIKFKMLFIGQGDLQQEIEQKIQAYHLEDEVQLLGLRTDIPNLLHVMDVFLMPSHFEGNPVSLIEAQAAGVPCVISDTITDRIDVGAGLVRKVRLDQDGKEWAEAILTAAALPRPSKEAIADGLKTHGYDLDTTTQLLMDIYLK